MSILSKNFNNPSFKLSLFTRMTELVLKLLLTFSKATLNEQLNNPKYSLGIFVNLKLQLQMLILKPMLFRT